MERKVKGIFDEINKILLGNARIPEKAIRYLDQDINFYQNYCNSLMKEPQNKENTVYYALFLHFMEQNNTYIDLVGKRETQCFRNYEEMSINLINGTAKYSGKVKESIEKELQETLYELLVNTKGKLERYGYIEELYRREEISLGRLGLNGIMPMERSAVEEATFSQNSFRFQSITEQIAINLFWLNKYWKVVGNSKLALWLLDTHKQNGKEAEAITDREKYLAIKREQILDYVQAMVTEKGGDMTFEEYLLCLYGKSGALPDTERMRVANKKMQKMNPELVREFAEIEQEYNGYFGAEAILGGQLVNDGLYNLYMLKEKNNVQVIKDILTRQLIELLVIDRSTTGNIQQRLVIDIPGYIKPVQVHIPDKLIADGKEQIPIYTGIYQYREEEMEKAYATNFLFKLNAEQAKLLKRSMKKRKENYRRQPVRGEKEIIQTMEYMNAVVNGQMGKLSDIMKMTEEDQR